MPVRSSASFGEAFSRRQGRAYAAPGSGVVEIERTVLENGVVVLSEAMPAIRSVSLGVWVRQGAAHEAPEESGVSHMLEHMVFKGTEKRTAPEIALALERLGGSLDAYTTREHTAYQARVLDEYFPEALDVLADLVLSPRLDAADLELEREVVLEEIAQVDDTPDDLVFELHAERFWREHPYGRPILGTRESVGALSTDVLARVHGTRYTGSNLVVAAAGHVRHDELVERVGRLFGAVPRGRRVPTVERPTDPNPGFEGEERATAQTHLVFGAPIPARAHPDRYAHILVSTVLGGGMSSRLFQRIREEMGLCYSVFSFQSFFREAGIAGVYVGTRPATAATAADAIRQELDQLAEGGLTSTELEDVRQQTKGQIMLSLESSGARLHRLASMELNDEIFVGLDELLSRIDGVTAEDVSRVCSEAYEAGRHYTFALGPGAGAVS